NNRSYQLKQYLIKQKTKNLFDPALKRRMTVRKSTLEKYIYNATAPPWLSGKLRLALEPH
ncbi:hypothetical protein, partial [Pseudomonas sp.]|uniref:hypothetical protein n=1 Tax=Pseudomonas sp. TaxID=306 RepID=UPI0032659202